MDISSAQQRQDLRPGRAVMKWSAVLCVLLLQTGAHGFDIFGGNSLNHQEITERAILVTTLQACRALALAEGKDFAFPPEPYNSDSVAVACDASKSTKSFRQTIQLIQDMNEGVDKRHFLSSRHHFDDEQFIAGRELITQGLSAVKASNTKQNFEAAREQLGQILHPLQDFYSHSNWVEMGNTLPNPNLIKAGRRIGNIAAETRATCRNCNGDDCTNNILEDILREKILTSGYFSLVPLAGKPDGKCSHGGGFDRTSGVEPEGGINKDKLDSEHGHLHFTAANMAIAATTQLLEDVRGAAGDKTFLRMMGITKGRALCFVIDTTGSMGDDIVAVRTVTANIINSKVGTEDEPSVYILVPFNDPDFGPLTKTTDPNVFKSAINSLSARGGGDSPEMSLSGLRLALTGAPPGSEIFLFTDASAKDAELKNAVIILIERTKSVVNFMITGFAALRRRRQSDEQQQQQQLPNSRMARAGGSVYSILAAASGGQAIQVSKSQLAEATSILTASSSASLVILLQATRNPAKSEDFTVLVDGSVRNLTLYVTGSSATFTLIGPSGASQSSENATGPLILSTQSVGNFKTVQLSAQFGLWVIKMESTSPYSLKVVGESGIDFLFTFLKPSDGPLGGFDLLANRPIAGVNGTLRVLLTGSDSATVTGVSLVESSSSERVNGSVEAQGGGRYLAHFDRIPSEFVILVKGENGRASGTAFQRQSSTKISASTLTVTTPVIDGVLEPGLSLLVPFSVETGGTGGSLSIKVTNDQGFPLTFPTSVSLTSGGSGNGTVNITAPASTPSGTDVTLTIEANAPGGTDTNYVLLLFTVLTKVTDFSEPVCELISLQANCSANCSESMWELFVQVTDGVNGTGIETISGTPNPNITSGSDNVTLLSYNAPCCSPDIEIILVDKVGNVGSCFYTVRAAPSTTPMPNTTLVTNTTQAQTTSAAVSLSSGAFQYLLLCLGTTVLWLALETGIN